MNNCKLSDPPDTNNYTDNSLSTNKYINKILNRSHPQLFSSSPAMDMIEDNHRVHISLDMPGFDIKDISITLNGHTLIVHGNKDRKNFDDNIIFYTNERKSTSIYRYIRLPINTNLTLLSSTYKNGVLFIQAPVIKYNNCMRDIPIYPG